MGNMYGYARVSTREQKEDRQIIAIREMNVPEENIYMDKLSGKDFNRPQYKRMVRKLKKDDKKLIMVTDKSGIEYKYSQNTRRKRDEINEGIVGCVYSRGIGDGGTLRLCRLFR